MKPVVRAALVAALLALQIVGGIIVRVIDPGT